MSEAYAHDVGRKVCLQLCSLNGYGAASDGALDVLADLMKLFLKESTSAARSYSENANRTEINALDIVTAHTNTSHTKESHITLGNEFG